ncbi:Hsp20/alpha crystallin family protein [Candidatus Micrarchaeota archaeon]|nr:Hsp20/alpha crystallin family protein [Candidatus Micrarchaeota archaeon]
MRWDPFGEMERMQNEVNRVFSSYKRRLPQTQQPALDLIDRRDELVVVVDLPGVSKEDVRVECTEDYLQIRAGSGEKNEEKKRGYYYSERSASSFSRGFSLPSRVVPEKANTTFKNGVLEIRLPKKEKTVAKKAHVLKIS